jgi:hypothetical protein
LPENASPVRLKAHLESLLRKRIAAGLFGEVSSKSLAAIVEEEMLSPMPDDGCPEQA